MDAQRTLGCHVDALLILPLTRSGLAVEAPETQNGAVWPLRERSGQQQSWQEKFLGFSQSVIQNSEASARDLKAGCAS